MKEPAVSNSICLIALERIGQLNLLPALFEPISVPPKVREEFVVRLDWLRVEAPSNTALVAVLKALVDEGEAEAIALARDKGAFAHLGRPQDTRAGKTIGCPRCRNGRDFSEGKAARNCESRQALTGGNATKGIPP